MIHIDELFGRWAITNTNRIGMNGNYQCVFREDYIYQIFKNGKYLGSSKFDYNEEKARILLEYDMGNPNIINFTLLSREPLSLRLKSDDGYFDDIVRMDAVDNSQSQAF
jgi:hypothetical protein